MRQDSVDEIDTTDLENWVLRPDLFVVEEPDFFEDGTPNEDPWRHREPRILDFANYK